MGFNKKRVVGFTLLTIVLAGLMISFVSAQSDPSLVPDGGVVNPGAVQGVFQSLWEAFFGPISDNFSFKTYEAQITRWFLIALVALIVYGVSDLIPFMSDNDYIKWGFAAVMGILAFLFIDDGLITTLSSTYKALGVAAATLLPLIVILAISYKLKQKESSPMAVGSAIWFNLFDKMLIGLFAIFLFLSWAGYFATPSAEERKYQVFYIISFVVILIWFLAGNKITNKIKELEGRLTNQTQEAAKVAGELRKVKGDLEGAVEEKRRLLESGVADKSEIQSLEKEIKAKEDAIYNLQVELSRVQGKNALSKL